MQPIPQHAPPTREQVLAVQQLLDEAGLKGRWFAASASSAGSPHAFRAERLATQKHEVVHHDPEVLVELAVAAEERLSGTRPTPVVNGQLAQVKK